MPVIYYLHNMDIGFGFKRIRLTQIDFDEPDKSSDQN